MMKRLGCVFAIVLFVLATGVSLSEVAAQEKEQPAPEEGADALEDMFKEQPREEETGDLDDVFGDEKTEEQYFRADKVLLSATKNLMNARRAPAITTVITADEMRGMGARNLMDVLSNVPGFGIYQKPNTPQGRFVEVRGILTAFSEKVLLLIDNHPMNNGYDGSWALHAFNDLMVENIKRVEIIRGPGSALFGANAFVGIINVITKMPEDIENQLSATGGSFDTWKYDASLSYKGEKFQISGHAEYYDTDGPASFIEHDALGNSGDTLEWSKKYDFGLRMAYGDFSFTGRVIDKEYGPFIGNMFALNDETVWKVKQFFGDIFYTKSLTEDLDIMVKLYGDYYDFNAFLEVMPDGFTGGNDNGMIGNPMIKTKSFGGEITANYVLGDHLMTGGTSYGNLKLFDVEAYDNYSNQTYTEVVRAPDFVKNNTDRNIWAVYLQNMWEISAYDSLTLGVRHDNYSDFGGTTNPRIGYVHEFKNNMIIKFLYGSAFRAPSFTELYTVNNVVVAGNPDLDPEKIQTYEVGLEIPFLKHYTLSLNYFHNDIEDLIGIGPSPGPGQPRPFINTDGKTQVDGAEAQLELYFAKDKYGYLNCSYQDAKDKNDKALPFVPDWKANAGMNYALSKYFNANVNVSWIGKMPRRETDLRDDVDSYTLVDLTLIAKEFYKGLEIRGSVYNLFDEDSRDPSPNVKVTNDLPCNARMFLVEARYNF
ncbi:MAG: TonB-dependent receptor [bacterium]|nr:TonB-dependent receptor [bacterium]